MSPNVDKKPLYSGTSVTRDSPPLTPPVKSCRSTVGAESSPELDNVSPIYSGLATVGAGKSPNVDKKPLYSRTSVTSEAPPFTPPVKSEM